MELFKSFFRKKQTKIYIFILTVIITNLIVVNYLSNYYNKLAYDNYVNNVYISLISSEDYYDEFLRNDLITNVKQGILLIPDYNNKNIIKRGEIYSTSDDIYKNISIFWDDFLLEDDTVAVYRARDYNMEVSDNEIIVGCMTARLLASQKGNNNYLFKKNISFISSNGNMNHNFIVSDIIDTSYNTFIISDSDFNKLKKENGLFSYRITAKNRKSIESLVNELSNLEIETGTNVNVHLRSTGEDELNSIITFARFSNIALMVLLFIIFMLICHNILNDEKKNAYINRLLGYSKKQVCKYIVVFIFLLVFLAMSYGTINALFISTILNNIFHLELTLINLEVLLWISMMILIISFTQIIYFYKSFNNFCKKSDM